MTFAEMKLELMSRCQNLSALRAGRFINDAVQELAGCYNWPFLEHSNDGAAPLAVSSCRAVLEVIDLTRETKLAYVPHYLATDQDPELDDTGSPYGYFLTRPTDGSSSMTVTTIPASTGQIRVRHIARLPELSADSDEPARIPDHYHGLIVDMAQLRAIRRSPENFNLIPILGQAVAAQKADMAKQEFVVSLEPMYIASTEYQL